MSFYSLIFAPPIDGYHGRIVEGKDVPMLTILFPLRAIFLLIAKKHPTSLLLGQKPMSDNSHHKYRLKPVVRILFFCAPEPHCKMLLVTLCNSCGFIKEPF